MYQIRVDLEDLQYAYILSIAISFRTKKKHEHLDYRLNFFYFKWKRRSKTGCFSPAIDSPRLGCCKCVISTYVKWIKQNLTAFLLIGESIFLSVHWIESFLWIGKCYKLKLFQPVFWRYKRIMILSNLFCTRLTIPSIENKINRTYVPTNVVLCQNQNTGVKVLFIKKLKKRKNTISNPRQIYFFRARRSLTTDHGCPINLRNFNFAKMPIWQGCPPAVGATEISNSSVVFFVR